MNQNFDRNQAPDEEGWGDWGGMSDSDDDPLEQQIPPKPIQVPTYREHVHAEDTKDIPISACTAQHEEPMKAEARWADLFEDDPQTHELTAWFIQWVLWNSAEEIQS